MSTPITDPDKWLEAFVLDLMVDVGRGVRRRMSWTLLLDAPERWLPLAACAAGAPTALVVAELLLALATRDFLGVPVEDQLRLAQETVGRWPDCPVSNELGDLAAAIDAGSHWRDDGTTHALRRATTSWRNRLAREAGPEHVAEERITQAQAAVAFATDGWARIDQTTLAWLLGQATGRLLYKRVCLECEHTIWRLVADNRGTRWVGGLDRHASGCLIGESEADRDQVDWAAERALVADQGGFCTISAEALRKLRDRHWGEREEIVQAWLADPTVHLLRKLQTLAKVDAHTLAEALGELLGGPDGDDPPPEYFDAWLAARRLQAELVVADSKRHEAAADPDAEREALVDFVRTCIADDEIRAHIIGQFTEDATAVLDDVLGAGWAAGEETR